MSARFAVNSCCLAHNDYEVKLASSVAKPTADAPVVAPPIIHKEKGQKASADKKRG
jgi:hypothetical protein